MEILKPLKINNIDLNELTYLPHKEKYNKKIIPIKYNGLNNFVFQTPSLLNINNIETYDNYTEIELSLEGKDKEKVDTFISFLQSLENKVKIDANNNIDTWFNKSINCINFQKIIRYSDKYNIGTLKFKIMKSNDFETTLLFKENKINTNDIPKNTFCKIILECFAIWINSNNDFGVFLRPIVMSFSIKKNINYNYKFIDNDSDDDNMFIPDTDLNNNMFMRIIPSERNKNIISDLNNLKEFLPINKENGLEDIISIDIEKSIDNSNSFNQSE